MDDLTVSRYLVSEHGAIVAELHRESIITTDEARALLGVATK